MCTCTLYPCVYVCVCECVGVQRLREVCRQQHFYKCLLCIEINTLALGNELDLCEQFFIITYVLKIQFSCRIVLPSMCRIVRCYTVVVQQILMRDLRIEWRDRGNE